MKFAMTKIGSALVLASVSAAASAAGGIGIVTELSITGGKFGMGAPAPDACNGGSFGSFQCITAGTANPIDADDGMFEGPTLTSFNFFNAPVTTWTAASAAGAASSTSGNPIEGTATASSITLDLGSFYANWNGSNFLQAPTDVNGPLSPLVTGTYDSGTGAFTVSWSSYITTAPFQDQTGYWTISGVATAAAAPVPEASTYGMMLAGLGLVGFAVRRRKLVA